MTTEAEKPYWQEEDGPIRILRCSVCAGIVIRRTFLASIDTKKLKYCPYCGTRLKRLEDMDIWG